MLVKYGARCGQPTAPPDATPPLQVAAWRARGRVPLGADITACLVQAQLDDASLGDYGGGGWCPSDTSSPGAAAAAAARAEPALRMQYSMAIVRMVNGIADSAQRGRVAASVASLAGAAGLPRLLVDLRHEATHNELPTLPVLRLAARQALAWLAEQYWGRQSGHLDSCLGRLSQLLQEYAALHAAAAAKVATPGVAEQSDDDEDEGPAGAAAAVDAAPSSSQAAGGGGGEAYRKHEAQRRRRALLAELRQHVPRPAAALLAPPLLDCSPEAAASGTRSAERGMAAALAHLSREWPQLPPLLAAEALRLLAAERGGQQLTPAKQAVLLAWLRMLLPTGGAADRLWQPSGGQAMELLALALPAYAAAAQRSALEALCSSTEASAGVGAAAGQAGELFTVVQQLVVLLRSAGGAELASRAAELANMCQALGRGNDQEQQQRQRQQKGSCRSTACTNNEEVEAIAAGAQHLAAAEVSQSRLLASGRKRSAHAPAAALAAGGKRWRRPSGWTPCAIGMLPSACDPNGRLPQLEQPCAVAAVTLSAQSVPIDQAATPAAAAPTPVLAAATLLQQPATEPAAHGTEPWPAADRFSALLAPVPVSNEDPPAQQPPSMLRPGLPPVRLLV